MYHVVQTVVEQRQTSFTSSTGLTLTVDMKVQYLDLNLQGLNAPEQLV